MVDYCVLPVPKMPWLSLGTQFRGGENFDLPGIRIFLSQFFKGFGEKNKKKKYLKNWRIRRQFSGEKRTLFSGLLPSNLPIF